MASRSRIVLGTVGVLGATLFTAVSASQGIIAGFRLGSATSELHGLVWAVGFLAGSLVNGVAWCAAGLALKRLQLGRALVAVLLGSICFGAATLASLTFVSTGRGDVAASREKSAAIFRLDQQTAQAAVAELSALNSEPRGNKKAQAARAKRRAALESTVAKASEALRGDSAPVARDDAAASILVYLSALGVHVGDVATISIWANLVIVLFIEAGSALSFVTVGILLAPERLPVPREAPATAEQVPTESEADAEASAKQRGRRRSVLPDDVIDRIRSAGGNLNGSLTSIAQVIGAPSKSTAHRVLGELEAAGALTLKATADGTRVAII